MEGKGWGREAMEKGGETRGREVGKKREGGKGRSSSHAFCFSNLGSTASAIVATSPRRVQLLQTDDLLTFYRLPFTPLCHLRTHLWQLVHSVELLTTHHTAVYLPPLPCLFCYSQTLLLLTWYSSSNYSLLFKISVI